MPARVEPSGIFTTRVRRDSIACKPIVSKLSLSVPHFFCSFSGRAMRSKARRKSSLTLARATNEDSRVLRPKESVSVPKVPIKKLYWLVANAKSLGLVESGFTIRSSTLRFLVTWSYRREASSSTLLLNLASVPNAAKVDKKVLCSAPVMAKP